VAELFQLTANNLEIDLLHFLGNRSYLAIADRSVVHRGDRSDLGTCTAEESFFGDVEFCSVDAANLYRDVQDLLCQNHNRVSGNAREEIVGFRRRDELPTSNNKDVLRAALRYVAIVGKDYGLISAALAYAPLHLQRMGMALSDTWRQEETLHLRPLLRSK